MRPEGVPLVVLAGKEYGSGSSRDWAAKGTKLLGVRAVIAESFERIHRSNLIGMGVLPLQFPDGRDVSPRSASRGEETFDVGDLAGRRGDHGAGDRPPRRRRATWSSRRRCGSTRPNEVDYFHNGGILQTVLEEPARLKPESNCVKAGPATQKEWVQRGRGRQGGPRDPHCTSASVAREGCRRGRSPWTGLPKRNSHT